MVSSSADGSASPAQPLFVVCSGVPDVDQDADDRRKAPASDKNDTRGEVKYSSTPCVAKDEDVKDPLLNGAADDSVVENLDVRLKSVLVPVRDPVTKKIKHKLVPVESKDETGLNIIKSVLIPCEDVHGTQCYEVRQVIVPIRPESTALRHSLSKNGERTKQGKGENGTNRSVKQEDAMLDVRNMCRICEIVYNTPQSLNTHVRRVHEKPYRCVHCHEAFVSKRAYKEHMKTHKLKTSVGCPFCQQRFKRMFSLRQHQIRVHSTIEPKFVCDHCGKRFKLKSDMSLHIDKSHMKSHGRMFKFSCHLCTICDKSYKYRNSFYRHVLTHAGMGPYHCDVCNADFEKKSSFLKHRKIHPEPRANSTIAEMAQRILQNN
ncbi:uncharacterized protein LOC144470323 [Augochlora pura]